ncbi:MAG: hypothetical protein IJH39_01190 [Clostridia bacterium]|nr:hypothetical protein [Clostridia bacterium]
MQNIKELYNKTLKRYYDGCNYLMEHPEEWNKYEKAVLSLLDKLNKILDLIPATEEEILNGFKT